MKNKELESQDIEDITKVVYDADKNIEVVSYKDIPDDTYQVDISTDKTKTRFIKSVEQLVRQSMEYSDYIGYLRRFCDMAACKFFPNINQEGDGKKIRVEIHHAPLTLYDICLIVLEDELSKGYKPKDMLLAKKVMKYHYEDQVGLIPLSKTLHELQHPKNGNPKFVIPLYMIYGQWTTFLKEYEETWQKIPYIVAKLQIARDQTKALTENSFDVLKEKFVYLSVDGFEVPVKIEDADEVRKVQVA